MSIIHNISIPNANSSCQAWKNYYQKLVKEFGKENAREAWLYTWSIDDNSLCTKDKDFNKWAEKNGIAVADSLDKSMASMNNIGQNILNGIGTMTGLTPKIGAALLVGGSALVLFLVFRIVKELKPTDLLAAYPAGRMGLMASALKKK